MNQRLIAEIAKNMRGKSTEELVSLYTENDKEQYSEEAFEATKQLLIERGSQILSQKEPLLSGKANAIIRQSKNKNASASRARVLCGIFQWLEKRPLWPVITFGAGFLSLITATPSGLRKLPGHMAFVPDPAAI